jgi:ferredoxin
LKYTAKAEAISRLVTNLRSSGYTVVGPKLIDGAVCLAEVSSVDELAKGVVDVQAPGSYRTVMSGNRIFSAVNGPYSIKTYLHPGAVGTVRLGSGGNPFNAEPAFHVDKRYAFLGLRPCELQAVRVLDSALMVDGFEDPVYVALRKKSVLIAVNCGRAGENCFCASMGTGPKAEDGFDLAITELPDRLLLEVGEEWIHLLDGIELSPATADDIQAEQQMVSEVTANMHKRIDRKDPAGLMYAGLESAVWDEVAERCLSCGNCTMVCPTCFCSTTRDVTDLNSGSVTRVRLWDSCLSKEFTYAAGGNPRRERKARYRQFVMHKFSYWPDQFKHLYGCVGCGRCITWCPVGIDISDTVNRVLKEQNEGRSVQEVAKVG